MVSGTRAGTRRHLSGWRSRRAQGVRPVLQSRARSLRGCHPAPRGGLGISPERRGALPPGWTADGSDDERRGHMTPIKLNLPILGQPNPSEPKDVHLVGRYALGVTWADDHSSIYPFDRLRLDDPALKNCQDVQLTHAMSWPRDIKKRPEGLRVTWTDEHESLYPYAELRALCRCAGCTGGH